MKNTKYVLALSCLLPFALFAQDAVLDNTIAGKKNIADAGKDFNTAVQDLRNANEIIKENLTRGMYANSDFNEILLNLQRIKTNLGEYKDSFAIEKNAIKEVRAKLEITKDNLAFIKESLPMGEQRFAFAEELFHAGNELVTKNPGDNYQDKRYFESVWNSYLNTKQVFQNNQKSLQKLFLDLNITNPRLEGIENIAKLSEDFIKRTEDSILLSENTNKEMQAIVEGLKKNALDTWNELSAKAASIQDIHSKLTLVNFKLSVFTMNDLPKNAKYSKILFAMDADQLFSSVFLDFAWSDEEFVVFSNGYEKAKRMILQKPETALFAVTANADSVRAKAISLPASFSGNIVTKPENIKGEILEICENIRKITAEISKTNSLLSNIVASANSAIDGVKSCEDSMSSSLSNFSSSYEQSQSTYSKILIFKSTLNVNVMQSKVSYDEYKKLSDSAASAVKSALEKAAKAEENLKAAKEALK